MIELPHCDLLFCLILGEEGHMSKDCETGPKTHTVQNEDGTTRGKQRIPKLQFKE